MTKIATYEITTDGGTQPRAQLNRDKVTEYADAMRRGDEFPAIDIYYDGYKHWLADGFHRLAAHKEAHGSRKHISVNIHQGTQRDAILHSVGANATHGLPRTTDDKQRAVLRLLNDDEWRQWSDREIARRTKTSHPFVAKLRKENATLTGNVSSDKRTFTDKHGNETTMNTAPISQSNQQRAETPINLDKLTTAVQTYIKTYKDRYGRTFPELTTPSHTNGILWADITNYFDSQNIPYNEPTLNHAIKECYRAIHPKTQPEPAIDPYSDIVYLESLLHQWLLFATGSRDRQEHLEWLAEQRDQGKKGEYFSDTQGWMEARTRFRKNDLWQACQNKYDQLRQLITTSQQTAEKEQPNEPPVRRSPAQEKDGAAPSAPSPPPTTPGGITATLEYSVDWEQAEWDEAAEGDDPRIQRVRSVRWSLEHLINQAHPEADRLFIVSLTRACNALNAAITTLKK